MTLTTLSVIGFDQIDHANADSRPHKIISSDRVELSTSDIAAGATVSVRVGQGSKRASAVPARNRQCSAP